MAEEKPKLILAYSGGLDTSVILKWLCEKGFNVIAFCANVGQFEEDFAAVKAKAVAVGASKCIVTDLRKEFVEGYVFEALKCNAMYEGRYLLGTSIARPCIAKEMIRIAIEEGATYVAHGATGKGKYDSKCAHKHSTQRFSASHHGGTLNSSNPSRDARTCWPTATNTAFPWMPSPRQTTPSMKTCSIHPTKVVC